ncbi:MAG: sigma-70 family RNA polymerase sigma factor, partial [Planctomycetes bacterium]|nr:sigma-70 family RNA polymerase sigma factor [Planctomycetota bacterium]
LVAERIRDDGTVTPSVDAARGEDIERLLEALEQLREDDQRVIELRDFEELSFRAIGERLGRSEAAVQMLHARAVTRLGQALRR